MATGCTVCVCGFPTELPPERVVDKLTVYFLRARNGGGEIANIEFAPESPDCAMVTFEEAAVAQQVLKIEKHVLTIGGKSYPLQVSPYTPGLDPNEIFVRVSMKIDYGRIPGGREILLSLCKQYGDIVAKFHSQEMTCLAQGPFTELQAFSSELLRSFQSKQGNSTPDKNSTPDRRRSAGKDGGGGTALQGVLKTQAKKNSQKAAAEGRPPRNPKENHSELPEDSSLVMDSDIYLYMQTFCQREFSSILHQHQVGVVDVSSEGIATLYLQTASEETRGTGALASAHLALSQLSQRLEATLRKEKISQRDLGRADDAKELLGELQSLCPLLLCQQDKEHLFLIGDKAEVSQARQYIQGFIAARKAVRDPQKPDVPQAESMAPIRGESPAPFQHVPSAGFLPRRQSLPRWPRGKVEPKLATRFSSASLPSFSSEDTPLRRLLTGDVSERADYHPAETRNHTRQGALAPDLGPPIKQSLETKSLSPATTLGGPWPSLEAWRSFGPERPLPFCASSSALRSSDIFGAVETADPKVSDLRRPSSSLLPKLENGGDSVDESLPVARINVDHLQPSSSEEGHRNWCQEADCQISSSTSLAVQRDGVSQAGHICKRFSYSELALEGPEDEALAALCSGLKACHGRIAVGQERHHLGLRYPQELKQQVLGALHFFYAQRPAVPTEQLLSHDVQQRAVQEDAPKTKIQMGEGSTAGPLEHPPQHLSSLAGENLSSRVQRFLDASQRAVEQNFPCDGKAWLSRELARAPVAGEQGCPGEPVAEAQQGLPGKFHLIRDSSKERCPREAEGASWSEPIPLQGFPAASGSKGRHWAEDSREQAPRSCARPASQRTTSPRPAAQPALASLDTSVLQPRQSASLGFSKI